MWASYHITSGGIQGQVVALLLMLSLVKVVASTLKTDFYLFNEQELCGLTPWHYENILIALASFSNHSQNQFFSHWKLKNCDFSIIPYIVTGYDSSVK